jgi:hypothetical protein
VADYDENALQLGEKLLSCSGSLDTFLGDAGRLGDILPSRINADPEDVQKGLAKLVLTLVELLRQLMERQAVRRIEGGSLTDDEIERLGQTFMKLDQRMGELLETFGLKRSDLNLNLGPLGDLM